MRRLVAAAGPVLALMAACGAPPAEIAVTSARDATAAPADASNRACPEAIPGGTIYDHAAGARGRPTVAAALPKPPGQDRTVRYPDPTHAIARELRGDQWIIYDLSRGPGGGWLLDSDRSGDTRCGPLDPEFTQPGQPLGP